MPLCDLTPASTSASDVDAEESTSAGGAGGEATQNEVAADESMQVSPPGPAGLAGPAGPNEASTPDALAKAAATDLSTPSSNSLEGEVDLPSPLCLEGSESPAEPHASARDGPLPETEARQRGLKRTGSPGASAPWSPIAAWGEDSRLRDEDDQVASAGTAVSKRRCAASKSAFPSAQPPVRLPSAQPKRARMHFRPIREDGSESSSS